MHACAQLLGPQNQITIALHVRKLWLGVIWQETIKATGSSCTRVHGWHRQQAGIQTLTPGGERLGVHTRSRERAAKNGMQGPRKAA
jgi:hypothetical protein